MLYHPMKTLAWLCLLLFAPVIRSDAADTPGQATVRETVDQVIQPLMRADNIPGMAIAVVIDGQANFFNYGVASRETRQPVTSDTLFEIGSISKTLTATLAAYAQLSGSLSLADPASKYLPALRGSAFDGISLLDLGTHTSGGLPLQVPENIKTTGELMGYLQHWQPAFAAGTRRVYSNVGIGLLGRITAESLHQPFDEAMEKTLLPALGMTRSYLQVPADQWGRYAQGYTGQDQPIRVSPGVLAAEAYGIKSCAADMGRFLIANLSPVPAGPGESGAPGEKLRRAVTDTHTGYFTAGGMTQDLIWEQYPYPVERERVLAGNSDAMITGATVATKLAGPLPPQANVLINKTGSTNGFAAYVAFVPARKLGVVLLANKRYDIAARVTAAYEILTRLDRSPTPADVTNH